MSTALAGALAAFRLLDMQAPPDSAPTDILLVEDDAELAQLVALQRAYDASMQVLEADDSAAQRLIQEVTR